MEPSTANALAQEFLNVAAIVTPKELPSLTQLWADMYPKLSNATPEMRNEFQQLLKLALNAETDPKFNDELDKKLSSSDDQHLMVLVRALHLKTHMEELDFDIKQVEAPTTQFKQKVEKGDILSSQLVLQSFLDYLTANGGEDFSTFLNTTVLRLVSTVHPNETERNTNLMHYTAIQDKFVQWKKDFAAIQSVKTNAPEYKIRRENLNQLRRAVKAEIEGLWQSDYFRREPINVQNEAKRILERYKVIFKAYPVFVKFVKRLANEAFWRYQASKYASDEKWTAQYQALRAELGTGRENLLKAVKRTFALMNIKLDLPRIVIPVITFGTWKGGDRDGNPFVVASFSNQTFVQQKEFVLTQYIEITKALLDKLTPSLSQIQVSDDLSKSLQKDHKIFPYITNIKPHEPYRAKLRYILEKLLNTLTRVREVKKQAGDTVKPLLSLSLPGPSGYNTGSEIKHDVSVLYQSLIRFEGKAQARSLLQDLQILVETFGLHMTAIDFRQTSDKNTAAVIEYMKVTDHPMAAKYTKLTEKEKQEVLISLLKEKDIELSPWTVAALSKISKDTFETFLIFADAARADARAVGKFIISMCTSPSDILTVLVIMKLAEMVECNDGVITKCPFDVTGLFETIEDLKRAPQIVRELLSIEMFRDYVIAHRSSKLTIMLGFSDSVRDGSCLASDSQIAQTTLALKIAEADLNRGQPLNRHIQLVFYRGRGDTLPRGFGGSVTKAMMSQYITTPEEDITEQNRYLRRYATVASTLNHLHTIYGSFIASRIKKFNPDVPTYLKYFQLFGNISNVKWNHLVKTENGGLGNTYFGILNKYSLLVHLPKSNFASRPVARDGVTYDIENIRAIPFTMALAQMREFTSAYYGFGTAFEVGIPMLLQPQETLQAMLKIWMETLSTYDAISFTQSFFERDSKFKEALNAFLQVESTAQLNKLFSGAKKLEGASYTMLRETLNLYPSVEAGVESISFLLMDLKQKGVSPLDVLKEMHVTFEPFRFCVENRETSLLIRNKNIVDDYVNDITKEERAVMDETENEAHLAKKWVLAITGQETLEEKNTQRDFHSRELFLLHKIQSKWMKDHRKLQKQIGSSNTHEVNKKLTHQLQELNVRIQVSILAISEALGFGG